MRICKPNEAGLILGMGSPSMMNWSGTQLQSPLAASTNPTPAPSTPTTGSVSPISPGLSTNPSLPSVTSFGGQVYSTPAPVTGPATIQGIEVGPQICVNPNTFGPTSEASTNDSFAGLGITDSGLTGNADFGGIDSSNMC
jgi:hypothetical protein